MFDAASVLLGSNRLSAVFRPDAQAAVLDGGPNYSVEKGKEVEAKWAVVLPLVGVMVASAGLGIAGMVTHGNR